MSKKATEPVKGIITIKARCIGKTPLLMNPMTEPTLDSLYTGVREPPTRDAPFREVAAKKVLKNPAGEIIIPTDNLYSCLVTAGRRVQYTGRSNISTATSTTLPEFFTIVGEELVLIDTEGHPLCDDSWQVDKRRGRNPKDGVAVCIIRPKFTNWWFEATFELDETKLSEMKALELLRIAGSANGLCDFRPNCKGRFGRFEVEKWEVMSRRPLESNFTRIDHTLEEAA